MMTLEEVKSNCKKGWRLNPKEKVVNGIIKGINRCEGECPCVNDAEDKICPCSNYRLKDKCCCTLYVKNKEWAEILLKEGKRVFVQDKEHLLQYDLFREIVVVSINGDDPVRVATDADFEKSYTE